MQEEQSLTTKGPVPVDPDLRWAAALRDFLHTSTFGLITPELRIERGQTDVELHIYLNTKDRPWKEMQQLIRKTCRTFVKAQAPHMVMQRVEFPLPAIHLLLYRKKEKLR